MAEARENVIEWITGSDVITITLTQRRYINMVKGLAETLRNNSDFRADFRENADGSIFAHLPLECLKVAKKYKKNIGEEEKEVLRARMKKMRAARSVNEEES